MTGNIESAPVLVLDGSTAQALAVVRSLGKRGIRVEAGSVSPTALSRRSRYCLDHFVYPNPLVDVPGFKTALLERLQRTTYSLVIPLTDVSICPLMEIRDEVEKLSLPAMASNQSLVMALSKSRTYELANALHIPVPNSFFVKDEDDFHRIKGEVSFPAVIKSDRSKVWSPEGRLHDLSVRYAFDAQQLEHTALPLLSITPIVVQQWVPGEGVGVGAIASKGEMLFAFEYRRLHEVPLTGGGSSYRISEPTDPKVVGYASSLLRGLNWDGVAMIEFRRDRQTGSIHLMEINGRFWGALPLAVNAGADFPFFLFELMVRGRKQFNSNYKIGFRCRNLSRDVEWLKEVLFRGEPSPIVQFPSYRSVLTDCARVLNPLEATDTMDWQDPRPGLIDLFRISRQLTVDIWKKIRRRNVLRKMERIQRHSPRLISRLGEARSILVVCQGNIVRSAFAAQLLKEGFAPRNAISVHSAGLGAIPGRPAHSWAVEVAETWGMDLRGHRSTLISTEMVRNADLIFVMEIDQLVYMRKRFRESAGKTYLLGCLSADVPLEVADPISKDKSAFVACFEQIVKTLNPVVQNLCKGGGLAQKRTIEV